MLLDSARAAWCGGTQLLKYGELLPEGVAGALETFRIQDECGYTDTATRNHSPITGMADANSPGVLFRELNFF